MNRHFVLPSLCALLLAGAGCKNFLATRGTGAHMDAPRERENHPVDNRHREIIVEVTTDPEGNVAAIRFQRSSGKDSLDAYVAETIHDSWPRQPSTRSVASITYSVDKGFSQPRFLSTTPAL